MCPTVEAAPVAVHLAPAVGEDPAVAVVALADAGAAEPAAQPTARAVVVYGVAAALHIQHGVPWSDALEAGERAFDGGARREAPTHGKLKRRKLARDAAAAGGPEPDLGLQPLDLVPRG